MSARTSRTDSTACTASTASSGQAATIRSPQPRSPADRLPPAGGPPPPAPPRGRVGPSGIGRSRHRRIGRVRVTRQPARRDAEPTSSAAASEEPPKPALTPSSAGPRQPAARGTSETANRHSPQPTRASGSRAVGEYPPRRDTAAPKLQFAAVLRWPFAQTSQKTNWPCRRCPPSHPRQRCGHGAYGIPSHGGWRDTNGHGMGQLVAIRPAGRRLSAAGVVLDAPVLMVDPLVLGHVEPHQPERRVPPHPGEQIPDLAKPGPPGPHGGLRQQHRLGRELPDLGNGRGRRRWRRYRTGGSSSRRCRPR